VCGAGGPNFVATMLRLAGASSAPVPVVADQHGCPTFTADLAEAIVALCARRLPGVFHVTNQGATTWHQLAAATFAAAGYDAGRVVAITTDELDPPRAARRPTYAVLDNAALRMAGLPMLPDHRESLERLVKELNAR
jgi:dTDP-4-dehydrorhamnose reductase